jgi:hypothetical protein
VFVFHIQLDGKPGAPEASSDIFRRFRGVQSAQHPNRLIRLRDLVGVRLHIANRLLHEAEQS